jgi:hypothetical protein
MVHHGDARFNERSSCQIEPYGSPNSEPLF